MDAGTVTICNLLNTAEAGDQPKMQLVRGTVLYYEDRVVGYNRQYAAMGAGERVDMLIRVWRDASIRIGMYALLEDYEGQENEAGDQYRISNVQHVTDDDGLKVTDLTLYRLEKLYEVVNPDT